MKIMRGVIIHGPKGTGKTLLIEELARTSGAYIVRIETSAVHSSVRGRIESNVRQLFEIAKKNAPSVVLVDEIETICPLYSKNKIQCRGMTPTLCNVFKDLHSESQAVVVLATSNDITQVNNALRRPGRFDKDVELTVPTSEQRLHILMKLLTKVHHSLTDSMVHDISYSAHGYVGADIAALIAQATFSRYRQCGSALQPEDFEYAMSKVKPSGMREVLIEVPNVKWSDIAGQTDLKLKLKQAIEWPIKHSKAFKTLGISPPKGVLMYGPPGCSKTMIAKALATESKVNFISVKGSELLNKWVGESEKAVSSLFHRASMFAPSIVFLDELDALGSERGSSNTSVTERLVAQLLIELDGILPLGNVTFVGATNRPDMIDKALLRPGRLDRIVYVPLPDEPTRHELFMLQFKKTPVASDIDIQLLAQLTDGYSGAEVVAVCQEAALKALEEDLNASLVEKRHIDLALSVVTPRTSKSLLEIYESFRSMK